MGGGVVSLEYLENNISMLKDEVGRANKNKNNFTVFVLTYPQTNFKSSKTGQRIPLTGSIDEIGADIQKIKEMGADHIIFCYLLSIEESQCNARSSSTRGAGCPPSRRPVLSLSSSRRLFRRGAVPEGSSAASFGRALNLAFASLPVPCARPPGRG